MDENIVNPVIQNANKNLALARAKRAENLQKKKRLEAVKNSPEPTVSLQPFLETSIPNMPTEPKKSENVKIPIPTMSADPTPKENGTTKETKDSGYFGSAIKSLRKGFGEFVLPLLITVFFTFFGSYASAFIANFNKGNNRNFNPGFTNTNTVNPEPPSQPPKNQESRTQTNFNSNNRNSDDDFSIFKKM